MEPKNFWPIENAYFGKFYRQNADLSVTAFQKQSQSQLLVSFWRLSSGVEPRPVKLNRIRSAIINTRIHLK
jgi:hypothetical protein